ncbi:hypothetical protein TSUD_23100 [Trifolium subterraneum]|uniref:Uncharacterized protein n=1 Tax=Trifolium subterraneum TaxID=3900 RepID=A0A2Z6N5U7_TRISU|nr:hypothetical protein TSUD_23100 [Trifolium subterraneum]
MYFRGEKQIYVITLNIYYRRKSAIQMLPIKEHNKRSDMNTIKEVKLKSAYHVGHLTCLCFTVPSLADIKEKALAWQGEHWVDIYVCAHSLPSLALPYILLHRLCLSYVAVEEKSSNKKRTFLFRLLNRQAH